MNCRIPIVSSLVIVLLVPWRASANIAVLGGLTHERVALPGESYGGTITIRNDGEEAEEVRIYPMDYLFFCDGTNEYGEPGVAPRSNAEWIELSPRQITIPPHETVDVNYRLTVPLGNNLLGTYWCILMVEPVVDPLEAQKKEDGINIQVLMRYGIQVVTHIGETGIRQIKFLNTKILREKGRRVLKVDVENIGERLLRPLVWVELYDEMGKHVGTYEGRTIRTYPGTSVRYTIDIDEVPVGTYKTLVVADCGGDDIFGINYTVQVKE
jgi:hypothetical protein